MHRRILVVEDDSATRLILRAMIEKLDRDSRVVCVDNAEAALSAIENATSEGYSFSLVLADIGLPRSNGLDLWRVCARRYRNLPFAFVTGKDLQQISAELAAQQQEKAPELLAKPVSLESLARLWGSL